MSKRRKANGGAKRSLAMSSAEAIALAEELDDIEEADLSTPPKPKKMKEVPLSYVPLTQPDAAPIRIRTTGTNCSDVLPSIRIYLLQECRSITWSRKARTKKLPWQR